MHLLLYILPGIVAGEHVRRAQTPDTEYYGRPDQGWCPLRQGAFDYELGGSVCALKCSSDNDCPPPSGGAKGPAKCYAHCWLRCSQDSDCPQLSGGKSFCGTRAHPFAMCFWE